uniref:Putative ovule protein n=1 Tax=Solanum chacoense TaxID=4108 RepID=A0A0V0HLS9_SOLCH
MSSPRFAGGRKYYDTTRFQQQQQQPHFLDACFLCNKPLGYNRDIFMYRSVFLHLIKVCFNKMFFFVIC